MDEIVKDFLIESHENLDRLDQELVKLESDPGSKELLASIFRTIHTIKGSCGFLGFAHLEKVAHRGENLLSKLRERELALDADMTSGLLAMVDAVRRMLGEIQATERDGDNDYPELVERLEKLQVPSQVEVLATATKPPTPAESSIRIIEDVTPPQSPPPPSAPTVVMSHVEETLTSASAEGSQGASKFRPSDGKIGGLLVDRGCINQHDLELALQEQEGGDRRRLGEILVAMGSCQQEEINATMQTLDSRGRSSVETVRVTVNLLDMLMNSIGELVLARNQLLQVSSSAADAGFQSVSQRMNLIVSEVQEQVMKTRMQPIGTLWNRFPRTVRDLALSCGKQAHLEMEGQDTELDRTIIEAIKDPLTHLVRNSIDHGIESPEVRKQAGKDPVGRITLRAFHEGGKVNLEISDDGAGLNVERLKNKAIERGLITAQQAHRMSERDAFNLIFLPGFSTAEKVTNVSGRGVGMDVVKTNVERISGAIDIQSALGKGTTVRVSIPLTLAIVPALIVNCDGERFAIPQVSVLELVGLDNAGIGHGIEAVQGAPVYRLRGNLLPLVYLDRELHLASADSSKVSKMADIVVLQAEHRQFGLVVDEILDTEEIVVKPLSRQLKGISAFSGATIMGDGRVALILDILGLAQRARVVAEARASASEQEAQKTHAANPDKVRTLLLARHGLDSQVAIPLSLVTRLEGFASYLVKCVGGREVTQYRDQIIPLVRLSQVLPPGHASEEVASDSIEVVIYSERGHTIGLIVDRIVDIVEERTAVDPLASRPGVVGAYSNQDQITELLDLPSILRDAVPGLMDPYETAAAGG